MTAPARPRKDLGALLNDEEAATAAMQKSVREAIIQRKRLGLSIFVWRDGHSVEIPAEEIPEDGFGDGD